MSGTKSRWRSFCIELRGERGALGTERIVKFHRIWRVLRERPLSIWHYARAEWLFRRTKIVTALLRAVGVFPASIQVGAGTRVQRLRCLKAEGPRVRIEVGEHGLVYEHARIEAYGDGKIRIGECAVIGDARIYSRASVQLGDRFLSSWNVMIQDYDPHPVDPGLRSRQVRAMCGRGPALEDWDFPVESITIGNDVWVGANVTILKGTRIGDGCLVAAGSVVTGGKFPARTLIAGNPARVVKNL